jgi:rare lipoprotein A
MLDLILSVSLNTSKIASVCGVATHYGVGDGYHGLTTANGEVFNAYGNSAASYDYPLGSQIRVTNQDNGQSVVVRVNDRGPHGNDAVLDLSFGAFSSIANPNNGRTYVCTERL